MSNCLAYFPHVACRMSHVALRLSYIFIIQTCVQFPVKDLFLRIFYIYFLSIVNWFWRWIEITKCEPYAYIYKHTYIVCLYNSWFGKPSVAICQHTNLSHSLLILQNCLVTYREIEPTRALAGLARIEYCINIFLYKKIWSRWIPHNLLITQKSFEPIVGEKC